MERWSSVYIGINGINGLKNDWDRHWIKAGERT
jgi:hypothetical protein